MVVIAHRLSTIRRAEQILVVESGRVIERGNHDALYAMSGRYYDLYTRQHGVESNLFLAPGEGDAQPELSGDGDASSAARTQRSAGLQDAPRMIRGQGNG